MQEVEKKILEMFIDENQLLSVKQIKNELGMVLVKDITVEQILERMCASNMLQLKFDGAIKYSLPMKFENIPINSLNKPSRLASPNGVNTVHKIKCPTCNSTDVTKISGANKVGAVALFGVFSMGHISKTFKCNKCGYKW